MIHLGMGEFDATVQTTTFVLKNTSLIKNGVYFRLVDEQNKYQSFQNRINRYLFKQKDFQSIKGFPFAYWATKQNLMTFSNHSMEEVANIGQGLKCGDGEIDLLENLFVVNNSS